MEMYPIDEGNPFGYLSKGRTNRPVQLLSFANPSAKHIRHEKLSNVAKTSFL